MKVTVIGAAGSVGAPAAFYIGVSGLVDELVLIDMRPNVVQQHALDMSTAMSRPGGDGHGRRLRGPRRLRRGHQRRGSAAGPYRRPHGDASQEHPPGARRGPGREAVLPRRLRHHRHQPDRSAQLLHLAGRRLRPPPGHRLLQERLDPLPRDHRQNEGGQDQPGPGDGHRGARQHAGAAVQFRAHRRRAVSFSEDEKQAVRDEIPTILRRYEELQSGRTAGWTSALGLAALTRAVLAGHRRDLPLLGRARRRVRPEAA